MVTPDMFDMPEYRHAFDLHAGVVDDHRAQALQRMMQRQAAQGTLRAGGITDFPTLDIERAAGQKRAQFGGQLALQQAGTRVARQDATTAFERQKEMFDRQIQAQKDLMQRQADIQRRMQGDMFWQNLGQTVIGTGVGALTGGLFGGLGALGRGLVGGFRPMQFNIPGGVGEPAVLSPMGQALRGIGMPGLGEGARGGFGDWWGQQRWMGQMGAMGIDPITLAIYQQMLQGEQLGARPQTPTPPPTTP